jgi:hypothetical protein
MYDRRAKERDRLKNASKVGNTVAINRPTGGCQNCSRRHLDQIKAQVNFARTALHEAKQKADAMRSLSTGHPDFDANLMMTMAREESNKRRVYEQLRKVRDQLINTRLTDEKVPANAD